MHQFCTLFDRNYLPRGLALYRSLVRTGSAFHLRVFCMDEATSELIERLALPGLEPISLAELELLDPALAAVKSSRTRVEYCWTATPAICRAAFAREPGLGEITYLDADVAFHRDPAELFDEIGSASVAIVPHRYSERWRAYEATSGIFNVEWLTFRNDRDGRAALEWWRDRCLEWCYARTEDGKFGDQKYLDDWPTRFAGVHVLRHPGGGVAPWNLDGADLWRDPATEALHVDELPVVFFHHHGLRLLGGPAAIRRAGLAVGAFQATGDGHGGSLAWASDYPVEGRAQELVWDPYLMALASEYSTLAELEPGFAHGFVRSDPREVGWVARTRARRIPASLRRRLVRRRSVRGWGDAEVAAQMVDLARRELGQPELPPPFRVFVGAVEDILEQPGLILPVRVLDVGCGAGAYATLLERHVPGSFEYAGWDASAAVVKAALATSPGRDIVVASLLENAVPADVDLVLASALIDVLPEPLAALDRLFSAPARFVLLHRQRITGGVTRVERAPGYDGQTTYRSLVTFGDIEAIAARHDRRISRVDHVLEDIFSFLVERADDGR